MLIPKMKYEHILKVGFKGIESGPGNAGNFPLPNGRPNNGARGFEQASRDLAPALAQYHG